jgi:hypothetical protein
MTGDLPHQRVDDEVFDPCKDQSINVELEHEAAKIIVAPLLKNVPDKESE